MATETIGYTDREQRDAEWRRLRATGLKGVVRYTTHDPKDDPTIIYVVAYPIVTLPTEVQEAEALLAAQVPAENGTEVPLTQDEEIAKLVEMKDEDIDTSDISELTETEINEFTQEAVNELDEQSDDSIPVGFRGVVELPVKTDNPS